MAFASGKSGKLTRKLSPGDTSLYLNTDLGITSGRLYAKNDTQVEFLNFTGKTNISATEWQYTGLTRQLSTTAVPSVSLGSGYTWLANQDFLNDMMHDQIFDASNGGTVTGAINFTNDITTTKSFKVPVYADATARDVGIPSPTNGMEVYITGLGVFQDYVLGAWTNRAAASITPVPTVTETQFESIIASGDPIGQTPDGIYKIQQEVKTSVALGGSRTYKDHCTVSKGVFFVVFEDIGVLYGAIATLTSADVMTWGTPVTIGTAATTTAKVAIINTNKVVIVYAANASVNVLSVIATVSGTTFSLGTALSEIQSGNAAITAICKVRTDCYAYCFGVGVNPSGIKVNTVSGTTITAGTVLAAFTFGFTQNTVFCSYLSDNLISFSEGITNGSNITNVKIYAITGGATTVATTYTGTVTGQGNYYHARYSDTEVILTNTGTTEKSIFTIPGAGTTLVKTTLTANGAVNYPVTPLYTNIYAINTGSTILVYQRDILIGTIASTPAYNSQSIQYDNGRIIFFNGSTLIPTIVNLARVFNLGVGYDNTGKFTIGRNYAVKSGILKGYRYYEQTDGTLSNGIGITNTVTMANFFGRGILTDRIMIEV